MHMTTENFVDFDEEKRPVPQIRYIQCCQTIIFFFFAAMSFYPFSEICTARFKYSRHLLTIYLFSIGASDLFVLKHYLYFKP